MSNVLVRYRSVNADRNLREELLLKHKLQASVSVGEEMLLLIYGAINFTHAVRTQPGLDARTQRTNFCWAAFALASYFSTPEIRNPIFLHITLQSLVKLNRDSLRLQKLVKSILGSKPSISRLLPS
jgi:hypothetical protein